MRVPTVYVPVGGGSGEGGLGADAHAMEASPITGTTVATLMPRGLSGNASRVKRR
jgi:hypothetical protein